MAPLPQDDLFYYSLKKNEFICKTYEITVLVKYTTEVTELRLQKLAIEGRKYAVDEVRRIKEKKGWSSIGIRFLEQCESGKKERKEGRSRDRKSRLELKLYLRRKNIRIGHPVAGVPQAHPTSTTKLNITIFTS